MCSFMTCGIFLTALDSVFLRFYCMWTGFFFKLRRKNSSYWELVLVLQHQMAAHHLSKTAKTAGNKIFFWITERNTFNQFHCGFGSTIGHLKWGLSTARVIDFNRNSFTFIKLLHDQWTAFDLFFPLIITDPN